MIDQKYMPNNEEMEEFILHDIIGGITTYYGYDYELDKMRKRLAEFLSRAIERALQVSTVTQQASCTVTADQNSDGQEK